MANTTASVGLPRLSEEAARLLRVELGEALEPGFKTLGKNLISEVRGKIEDALSELEGRATSLAERASSHEEIASKVLAAASETKSVLVAAQHQLDAWAADIARTLSSVSAANAKMAQHLTDRLTTMRETAALAQQNVDKRLSAIEGVVSTLPEARAQIESRVAAHLDAAANTIVAAIHGGASRNWRLLWTATIGLGVSALAQLALLLWLVFKG